jgi:GH15 family glucan-1,4-alpha-glucosidase
VPLAIEDYALIGGCHTAALVGRDGSIDWLCFPRFDSGACFAALLGEPGHGRWLIAPAGAVRATRRRYREDTLILETDFETAEGAVRVTDCMPLTDERWNLVRRVEGLHGEVAMRMELIIRFDYGWVVPWVQKRGQTLVAIGGPDTLELHAGVAMHGKGLTTVAEFSVRSGQRTSFALNYRRSHEPSAPAIDPDWALETTERSWREWSGRCTYRGRWREAVMRSLITLKALTYAPTGGIVAAPTTSLPEKPGGVRNWDYRFCWLRDATSTLNALLAAGYQDEAAAWREWLLRAAAGRQQDLQALYSVTGERRLDEAELGWLPGYKGAAPVRIGNAASKQLQLDVYGEVVDTLHLARCAGLPAQSHAWRVEASLVAFLERNWQQPDEGMWEIRGPRRHFTHSKVMAWVAFDRAVKAIENFGLEGPLERWRRVRDAIRAEVCEAGFDAHRNTFVQSYGSTQLDASLLLIPLVGFLPPEDPRVLGTLEAIERELVIDGLVRRYSSASGFDGLPPGEGAFLPCSFWLADNLALVGRQQEAEALFERLLALRNDAGLLPEEYDPRERRMLGNFPQALTHVALVNTARLLFLCARHARHSSEQGGRPAAVAPATA